MIAYLKDRVILRLQITYKHMTTDNSRLVQAAVKDLCDAESGKFCDWHQETDGLLWVKHRGVADTSGYTGPTTDSSGSNTGKT